MTPTPEFWKTLKESIINKKRQINKLHDDIDNLENLCEKHGHKIEKKDESMLVPYLICTICGKDFGWWCPDSPNNQCEYVQDDGSYDGDSCKYCGQPSERK